MPDVYANHPGLFDQLTGKWFGVRDLFGREQIVLRDAVGLAPGGNAATWAANTAHLQELLTAGGDVRVTTPGVYNFDVSAGPLALPSNTRLYLGAGVTTRVADGSPSALFTNAAARTAGTAVAAANVSYATAPDGFNQCVTVTGLAAGVGLQFPVNSWVSAVVLGHGALGVKGTAWAGRGYRGVYRVVESTSTSLKYLIDYPYPGSGPSSNNITLHQADENILIWGPGTIDGNGALASQAFITGDPRGNVIWWRHANNVRVEGPRFHRGVTWTIGSNYVRNLTVRACTLELRNSPTFNTIDFVHLSGNHQTVLVEDCVGGAADNFVGMTTDCTEGTAFDFPYQAPGDMYDITIRNATAECVCEDGFFAIVGIYGAEAYRYQNIVVDGVRGLGSAVVQLANYGDTRQHKLNIDDLNIRNVRNGAGIALRIETGVYDVGRITVEKAAAVRESDALVSMSNTATGTVRSLRLDQVEHFPYDNTTYSRAAAAIALGGLTITSLKISGIEGVQMAVNIKLIERTGAGAISKFVVEDVSATGSGTGAVYANSGGGSAPTVVYSRSSYNGAAL